MNKKARIHLSYLIILTIFSSISVFGATKTWTGSVSTDWSNASNWSGGLPGSGDDVVIPGSLSRYPNIITAQSFTVKSITVNSGATLNISGGSLATNDNKITVDGGTINQSGGTVITKDMELKNGGIYNQSGGEFQISHDLKVKVGASFNGTGGTVRFTGAAGPGAEYYGTVQFHNLIVDAGADYNMDNNADVIKISGNYTNNNSSLDDDKGTLHFNGTSPQTIYSASSPASTKTMAGNIIVSNSTGVTLLTDVGFHTSLTLQSGGFINKDGHSIYVGGSEYTAPVPVELVSFNAKVRNNSVHLNWKTATEVNNYGFEIERASSSPLQEWEKVGFVNGHGNSNSPKEYYFEDSKLNNNSYQYRLKQVDNDGSFSYSNIVTISINQVPGSFALYQNYPNPFNPATIIKYTIAEENFVTIKLYNIIGSEIMTLVNEKQISGNYEYKLDASSLTSGVYIYKIAAGDFSATRKMILSK